MSIPVETITEPRSGDDPPVVEEEEMVQRARAEAEAEIEAAEIFDRIHRELAAEEARADRLLQFYGL